MQNHNLVRADSIEVGSRLAALGLTIQILADAVLAGYYAAAATTLHHPKNHAGFVSWSEPVKMLRDLLIALGWVAEDIDGQPLVRNARNTVAITVSGGDHSTGLKEHQPKTRSPKGPVTLHAVETNSYWLFPDMEKADRLRIQRINQRQMFMLLIYMDDELGEIRSELSLPVATDGTNHICGWSERIILPAIPYGDEPMTISHQSPNEDDLSGSDAVQIRRKA